VPALLEHPAEAIDGGAVPRIPEAARQSTEAEAQEMISDDDRLRMLADLLGARSERFDDVLTAARSAVGTEELVVLREVCLAAGEVFYRRAPQVEDRARLDAAMRQAERFPFAKGAPWARR